MSRLAAALFFAVYALSALVAALALVRFTNADLSQAALLGALTFLAGAQVHTLIARAANDSAQQTKIETLRKANISISGELERLHEEVGSLAKAVENEAVRRDQVIISEVQALESVIENLQSDFNSRMTLATQMAPALNLHTQNDDKHLMLTKVREALEAGRVDLHLQPIVSLPQRKTYFYESFTRLRDHQGNIIMPAEFLKVAEPAGLVSVVDNLLLLRCVQIVRQLTEKDRQVGIVCNISAHSLRDESFFPQFLDFMRQNSDLSGSVVFEIGHQDFCDRGPVEARNMARLGDFGFQFSIDKVNTLEFDAADMQRSGVKFLKIASATLLSAVHASDHAALPAAPDIRIIDIAGYLARFGIELIGEKVEDEASVVELVELEAAYAQGHLFGEPRPIREEFLAGMQDDFKIAV